MWFKFLQQILIVNIAKYTGRKHAYVGLNMREI